MLLPRLRWQQSWASCGQCSCEKSGIVLKINLIRRGLAWLPARPQDGLDRPMKAREMPSKEELDQLLRYDPETGQLFWKAKTPALVMSGKRDAEHSAANWNGRHAGKEAFICISTGGYRKGRFLGREMYAHRVIWKMVHGHDPEVIDHINGDRGDNRLNNLRSIRPEDNNKNMGRSRRNRSGVIGVSRTPAGRWSACIVYQKRFVWLGSHAAKKDAISARHTAEREFGFMPTARRGGL